MGRRENPIDPEAGVLARFAADLRALRLRAGSPTYRELAPRAFYSASTLSQAASGVLVPSRAVTLAFVSACGGDIAEWDRRWRALQQAMAEEHRARVRRAAG